jgi:predicted TIM-barrel fold metal-dependent hydrolase
VIQNIVDAHHHIWRQSDLLWLQGPTVPRIFGNYDPIKRDYPIEEFLEDIQHTGVVRSIYVQTNWPAKRILDEVDWVETEAKRTGWPHAIVSFIDLLSDDAPRMISDQAERPLVRGVRQQIHWHQNPLYRFAQRPDITDDPNFRQNLARLQDHDWLFELQVFTSQMKGAAHLARDLPGNTFVLEHAGMLEDLSAKGRSQWREGMKRLAEHPNLYTKLSGLGTFARRNDPQHIADIVGETVQIFGADRCLWGSNFPIEKIWTDYSSLLNAVHSALSSLPSDAQEQILFSNAMRLYRLPPLPSNTVSTTLPEHRQVDATVTIGSHT